MFTINLEDGREAPSKASYIYFRHEQDVQQVCLFRQEQDVQQVYISQTGIECETSIYILGMNWMCNKYMYIQAKIGFATSIYIQTGIGCTTSIYIFRHEQDVQQVYIFQDGIGSTTSV